MPRKLNSKSNSTAFAKLKVEALGSLIKKHPSISSVLHDHGIHFCSGCYITLFSALDKAAAYHAVTNLEKLIRDLDKTMRQERSLGRSK